MYINKEGIRIEIYDHISLELFLYECLVLMYDTVQENS
jgi:hypothetical protein